MSNTTDKISAFATDFASSLASCFKILLLSKWNVKTPIVATSEELVILGNGPSLNDTIAKSSDFLESRRLMAVNFAGVTELFLTLRPEYYVLADPHFFNAIEQPNVAKLWSVLSKAVDWNMTLFLPASLSTKNSCYQSVVANSNITIIRYNLTPVEGFKYLERFAFACGLGMPRPRNVLIPSLMLALRMHYKTIYVAGADHSWTKTLSVDDQNHVVSIQPHFYKENEKERKRVDTEYMKYPLYKIMHSFYVAFKSYFIIEDFARSVKAKIWNITPSSFIDAFERKNIL
ncbi:MAG: hypothetical protein PHR45_03895 [Muribaculaceae bacterium]|nr:hypothetical protein [Muribaculaceae bacterium]